MVNQKPEIDKVQKLVQQLLEPEQREQALIELSKVRESFQDLALYLWFSQGTVAVLLQEVISTYPCLDPPTLSPSASNRVCNALALLQCIASHQDTRLKFLKAQIPLFLYPFLQTTCDQRPFEYLRLTSLGVIGALVKQDDQEVISFLLKTEIVALCLRTMETGSDLSKTVATFIIQKILLDDFGLDFICSTPDRFFAVGAVLANMVQTLKAKPSPRLLKHIIRCYLRLSENPRACEALRQCIPDQFKDKSFTVCLEDDQVTMQWLHSLLENVGPGYTPKQEDAMKMSQDSQLQQQLHPQAMQQNLVKPNLINPLAQQQQIQPNQISGFQQNKPNININQIGFNRGLQQKLQQQNKGIMANPNLPGGQLPQQSLAFNQPIDQQFLLKQYMRRP